MLHGAREFGVGRAIRGAALAALVALWALAGAWGEAGGPSQASAGAVPDGPETRACRVTETGRDTLMFADGRVAYVEAETLVPSGGSVLLVGSHAYVFERHPGGELVHRPGDAIAGAVIGPDGTARPVPPPLPGRPAMRYGAAALEGDSWGVVFIETEPGSEFPDEVPVAPWYGVFDGLRWTGLERLPVPEGRQLSLFPTSSLVRRGDGLLWGVTVDRGADYGRPVVYTRGPDGGWSYELWPFRAAYLDLAVSERGGLVAAVVRWDTTLHRDENSLFLYANGELRRVALGRDQPVHAPSLVLGDAPALSWWAIVPARDTVRYEARAVFGDLPARGGPVIRLDPDVLDVRYLPTPDGHPLWLTDSFTSAGKRSLRLIGLEGGTARVLWEVPSPYEGSAAGVALTRRDVLLAGPLVDRAASDVFTLLIRLDLDCPGPLPGG